jgi:signal transduction histidine kinase
VPRLIHAAEGLEATPDQKQAIELLSEVWLGHERLRALAERVQRAGAIDGVTTANFWFDDAAGLRWLALLNPSQTVNLTQSGSITNQVTRALFLPRDVVGRMLDQAVRTMRVAIPDYLALSFELEGEQFGPGETEMAAPVLATARGALTKPAVLLLNDPSPSGPPPAFSDAFESLPSRPAVQARLHLAHSERLYARQQERTRWLALLVGGSTLAALLGLFSAWRGFHRQLELNEMKSNFVSSVSHELRAPLASVRLMAESLHHGKVSGREKQLEYFGLIGQECRRLSGLVENVLDFARIEQGRKQYEFVPTDIHALVNETVRLMQPQAESRRVRLALSDISTVERVEATLDGRALQQALVNLIDNALKHSPENGGVMVRVEAGRGDSREDVLTITVEDEGPGIPVEEQRRVFEPFYRRGSELRRETPGVGIGLSIVRHIAEANGGEVRVESAPGQGSRFLLLIPMRNAPPNGGLA